MKAKDLIRLKAKQRAVDTQKNVPAEQTLQNTSYQQGVNDNASIRGGKKSFRDFAMKEVLKNPSNATEVFQDAMRYGMSGGATYTSKVMPRKVGGRKKKDPANIQALIEEVDEPKKGRGRPKKGKQTKNKDAERSLALGKEYAQHILDQDEEVRELKGKGFWGDFQRGFSSVVAPVGDALGYIPLPPAQVASVALKGADAGVKALTKGKGKGVKKASSPNDKRKIRGKLVSKLMKEEGLTLAQASKAIKERGLM